MDFATNTEQLCVEVKTNRENILLEIIKELCSGSEALLSSTLKGKVNKIISDCDRTHYFNLHKLSTADESVSTLLGLMQQTTVELTFNEQAELNQAIIQKINKTLPMYVKELNSLKQEKQKSNRDQIKELQESLDNKLNTLQKQESEKVELMMEWLNHRLKDSVKFSSDSSELLNLKTRTLEVKSKILHLQILQKIFTETNNSIKAYSEIHKDLMESLKETESRMKQYQRFIDYDSD